MLHIWRIPDSMIYKNHKVSLAKGKSFYLIAFGDVHWNSDEADKKHFLETINFGRKKLKAGHKVGMIGLGDYNDSFSTSERKAFRDLHDFSLDRFDEWAAEISETFYEVLKPLKGSFVGLNEGHHFISFQSGKKEFSKYRGATNTKYLCDLLDTTYFGTCGYITLDFGGDIKWDFIAHHGAGAGQSRNARILKRKRFLEGFPSAAACVLGHDHDAFVERIQGLGIGPNGTYPMTKYLVASGSYLRGYILGRETGTYVEQALYAPNQLGSAVLEFTIQEKKLAINSFLI
jgi:hypothetical protein